MSRGSLYSEEHCSCLDETSRCVRFVHHTKRLCVWTNYKTCVKKCETESRRFCQSSLHKCVNLRVHRMEHATALCSCCLYRRPWSELSSEVPPPLLLSAASSPAAASAALPSPRLRSSMRCGISIHMPVKTVYCVVYTQNKPTAPYLRTRQGRTTSRVAVAPGHPRWRLASKSSSLHFKLTHTYISI